MKAIMIQSDKSLLWTDVPDPKIGDGDVLIKVEYAAVNRADPYAGRRVLPASRGLSGLPRT